MAGILTFPSLAIALREGFQVEERTKDGYIVRRRTSQGWVRAVVFLKGDR